ncbi:MAG: hypothetical protein BEU00_02470 [Marine Group III euryarchaeote CG-Epi3]|uniref:Glycosyl transferase family 1 domain-containing protein n=1 Tax=Marine Group III euryarchaeote CG-Epi3 TaxID=1888997 RepID=A0A1J5UC48_9ARCH|nr:MAG: hypothetical protein BEU00_02470 [Marine Group III euryarchaeote CG-Epi3]|tara:strand:+ start:96 stop:1331 length:1236 start_codon:yes stop_codon:yes gene_type:complete
MVRTRLTTGGFAEPVVADTAKSLSKMGHRVILLAWDRTARGEETVTTDWGTIWKYQEKCSLNNPLAFARKLPGFLRWSSWQILAFQKIEQNIILHYHDLDTLIGGVFTSKLSELPLVYDCHENYPGLVKGAISQRGANILHKIEAYLLKYCTGIMAAGPAGYVRLNDMLKIGTNAPFNANEDEAFKVLSKPQSEFLNSRITRVGNAKRLDSYPLTRIEKRKRKDEFRLLYIGVLEKHPSRGIIETAITVNKMKGIQFDIGGFGTLVPTIKRICEKMDNVNYIGSIHPDNVPLQTIESDAVLMALDPKNDNNRMSAPNKLFEAMSAGVPVITCKELLMGKFVENEEIGLTFEWGKWDRLKAAIMKLVYDKELQEKMGRRGRKLAEKTHNWGKCEERIESLYRYVKLNAVNPS